jgi:hypothetical protein
LFFQLAVIKRINFGIFFGISSQKEYFISSPFGTLPPFDFPHGGKGVFPGPAPNPLKGAFDYQLFTIYQHIPDNLCDHCKAQRRNGATGY